MFIKIRPKKPAVHHEIEQKKIINGWFETIAELHENHNRLTACLNQLQASVNLSLHTNAYIGQCPIGQIVMLIRTIEAELEILLLDMDDPNPAYQSDSFIAYKKPVAHILVLQRLNTQARKVLFLTTLPELSTHTTTINNAVDRSRWN